MLVNWIILLMVAFLLWSAFILTQDVLTDREGVWWMRLSKSFGVVILSIFSLAALAYLQPVSQLHPNIVLLIAAIGIGTIGFLFLKFTAMEVREPNVGRLISLFVGVLHFLFMVILATFLVA